MSILFTGVFVYDADEVSGMYGPTDVYVDGTVIDTIGADARSAFERGREGAAASGVEPTGASAASDAPGGTTMTGSSRVIDGGGHHLLVPGLINAHFHSPANHLKGSLPSLPLELFMLYESPADPALAPTPREAYLRTMLAALEMLRTGTTTVQDDAFLMPYPTPDIIDAVMQAYADCGIRASVALDQPELSEAEKLPFIAEGADEALLRGLGRPAPLDAAGLLEAYAHLIERWHGAEDGRLTAAVSISAPQRVSPEYFGALDELSRLHHIPLFAHMLETKVQRTLADDQPRFGGRSLVQYTADLGLLSDRMNVIHAVWVDDTDLRLIAESGATVAHNPVSNLRLGSGVAPYRRMRDHGVTVSLGIDEAICDDSANVWGVVKATGLIHNVSGLDSDQWPRADEVLDSLWRGGASALLQSDRLGMLEEGYLADLAMLDLHSNAFTPFNDLRGQLVYCESGTSVRLTVVNGEVVFENGALTRVDEEALLAEAREFFARKLPVIERARRAEDRVFGHYQAMVRRAAATDVGMTRWIGNA
ncbi:amidohydrolase family protein [Subtercola boreus]|uniref:Amidohydrolase n=1 Tax=Subtercola boreus TaxID=120213 RepID=A0A3E0W8E6_9MICO|nr:amidohydrolase family protein [Subtercola boreus]RFA18165.1 amidohydrolase [Subtercola boreus]RFA18547.1 amidohydrolase [Subtercola boreus]RFA25075.1 amidohydrolase [Subtercola boreus]